VDDDPFEREEIGFSHSAVLCIDAAQPDLMLTMPEFMPYRITEDSKLRRLMYLTDISRKEAESIFVGPKEEFLATLELVFSMWTAREDDLERAEELTVRTHQLNSSGKTYSLQELDQFRQSDCHKLLIASLEDRFGSYGRIGLALLEFDEYVWTIKLLLMSCRVISRGVGTIMLGRIIEQAKEAGVVLRAEFVANERNRMMYITYKFAGFKELSRNGDFVLFENDLRQIQPPLAYVKIL
jgi:FkbH-like protein